MQIQSSFPRTSCIYGVSQWWANYDPRARCGPLRGSIRPAADFKI